MGIFSFLSRKSGNKTAKGGTLTKPPPPLVSTKPGPVASRGERAMLPSHTAQHSEHWKKPEPSSHHM